MLALAAALFSGQKKLALKYLGTQMNHARDQAEKDYLNGFGAHVYEMPDDQAGLIAATAEIKRNLQKQ